MSESQSDSPRQQKLNVLFCTDHFYPDLSSGGRLLTDLAEGLSHGMNVSAITAFSDYNAQRSTIPHEIYQGITIDRVWHTRFQRHNLIGRVFNEITFCISVFFKVLTGSRPDVIYVVSSPPFLPLFISFIAQFRGIPYLYVMLDVFPDIAVKMGVLDSGSFIVRFWEWLSTAALRRANRIVVLGRCMIEIIRQKLGSRKVPVDVIHNWSDKRTMYPISKEANPFFESHSVLKGKFIALYSGNLGRFQDFETILKTAEAMREDQHVQFVIVGDGARKAWLSEQIQARGLYNVSLLPFVPQDQLIFLLNAADVGLVTLERGAEGLGVPSKFYPLIAAGIPIIALMGANAEVALQVREADIGRVVVQGDVEGFIAAIKTFSNDPDQQKASSLRARQLFLEHFDREFAVEAYRISLQRTAARQRDTR
jgi:glycosyltransferase involved in cell wall biosynthesis